MYLIKILCIGSKTRAIPRQPRRRCTGLQARPRHSSRLRAAAQAAGCSSGVPTTSVALATRARLPADPADLQAHKHRALRPVRHLRGRPAGGPAAAPTARRRGSGPSSARGRVGAPNRAHRCCLEVELAAGAQCAELASASPSSSWPPKSRPRCHRMCVARHAPGLTTAP